MGSLPENRERAVCALNATAGHIEKAFTQAGIVDLPVGSYDKFRAYLELLLHWNQRLSLTAVREPDQIIQRHFLECAFAAGQLPQDIAGLLDYGSGAGLPGIPIAICRPEIGVTLAEAHGKKASFLREALRVLKLDAEVYDGRVEEMPERTFDAVTLRAVEKMDSAIPCALERAKRYIVLLTTKRSDLARETTMPGLVWLKPISIPQSKQMILEIGRRD